MSDRLRNAHGALWFKCPGCEDNHVINTDRWKWNGSMDKPTFNPSLMVRGGHYASVWKPGDECWCTFRAKGGETGFTCYRCHSWIRDGRIQFLNDCTHALAGKTVDLPEIE